MTESLPEEPPPGKQTRIDIDLQADQVSGKLVGLNVNQASGPIEVNTPSASFAINLPAPEIGGYIPAPGVETYLPRGEIEFSIQARLLRRDGPALAAVVGPPGLGKSELAKQVALRLKDSFEAVLWVDLGSKTSPQVITDLARQAGVRLDASLQAADRVVEVKRALNRLRVLVVYDDVRPHHTAQLRDLLPPSPPCATLLTSRLQQLGALPPAAIFPLQNLGKKASLALLTGILGEKAVTGECRAALALVKRCRYNPLALDIAARRILQLAALPNPIATFLSAVSRRLEELSLGDDPSLDLFSVFDESYTSLLEADQRRFRRLAAFAPTGFSPSGAAVVWADDETQTSLALARLVNLSLLAPVGGSFVRWRLHDLLDEYAAGKLAASGEEVETRQAQVDYLIALFERDYEADVGRRPEAALELDNLRLAARWVELAADARRLAVLSTVVRNWMVTVFHDWESWEAWLSAALRHPAQEPGLQADVFQSTGDLLNYRHRMDDAVQHYRSAVQLHLEDGNLVGAAQSLLSTGDVFRLQGRPQQALEFFTRALDLFGRANHLPGMGNVFLLIGELLRSEGRSAEAQQSYLQALQVFQSLNQRQGQASALYGIGELLAKDRNYPQALNSFEGALLLFGETGDLRGQANAHWSIGKLFLHTGRNKEAEASLRQALETYQSLQDPLGQAHVLRSMSELYAGRRHYPAALQSAQAAAALYQAIDLPKEQAAALHHMGDVLRGADEPQKAVQQYQQAVEIYWQIGRPALAADVLVSLARVMLDENPQQALEILQQAVDIYNQAQDGFGLASAYGNFGLELKSRGRLEDARRFLTTAAQAFDQFGFPADAEQVRRALSAAEP